MGYKAYLIEQYDTTHENIFFKEFSEALSNRFQNENSNVILTEVPQKKRGKTGKSQ